MFAVPGRSLIRRWKSTLAGMRSYLKQEDTVLAVPRAFRTSLPDVARCFQIRNDVSKRDEVSIVGFGYFHTKLLVKTC